MSFDYSGSFSGSFYGDITASNGVVSSSNQINYNSISNRPVTISAFQKNSIVANNNFRQVTNLATSASVSTRLTTVESEKAILDSRVDSIEAITSSIVALNTESGSIKARVSSLETDSGSISTRLTQVEASGDNQTLTFNQVSKELSISEGNVVDLSSLGGGGGAGGSSIWTTGSGYYKVSADLQVTGSFEVNGGITGSIDWSNLDNVPSGLVSSSHTDISSLNTFTGSAQTSINALNAASSSYLTSVPSGTISGSSQITSVVTDSYISASAASSGFGQGGGSTDISALNTFTGSAQTSITALNVASSSYLTSVPSGTVSSSAQITALGFGGGGSFNATPLNNFTGSAQTSINALNAASSSYLTSVGSITTSSITDFDTEVSRSISQAGFGSSTLPGGTISSSAQVNFNNIANKPVVGDGGLTTNDFTTADHNKLDLIEASADVTDAINVKANLPSGVVSSSNQITALGFGGGSTNIVPLNTFTGSAQTSLTALNTFTGSAISNSQTASMSVATSSFIGFDGNRVVSNTDLPSGIYNTNFGTTTSLSDFVSKVFFPNTVPTINTNGFTIGEFVVSGSTIGTITGTDAEGQSFTFRTASSYSADKFKISTAGAVTLNTKSTASLNTDSTPGSGSHPIQVEAVDTFGGVGSKTIYIRVTPNTAPKWRQTSVGGSIITNFTHSLNENSTAGNNKVRVYFTDDESDEITIKSGSVNMNGFTFTKYGTYVQLNQTTASLDFEVTPKYEIVLTASDEHHVSGDDSEGVAYLPFRVSVVDNVIPTVNNQTLSSINENSADGASLGTITANDSEGDTIVFSNFTLLKAFKNGVNTNITSSLGGVSLYNPHSNPFQCSSAGVVTRKNGIYLNSDIADRYVYQVTVKDAFNTTEDTGEITIPITADATSAVSDNWTNLYIIESATSGDNIKVNADGLTGNTATWTSAVSQRWSLGTVTGNLVSLSTATGSSTTLQIGNLSGSAYASGSTISVAVTASEHGFETTKQFIDVDINVVKNNPPSVSFNNQSENLNTNGARSGSTLSVISFTDAESNNLNHPSFVFTDPSGQLNTVKDGNTYFVQAINNLSASTYQYTASIKDSHGFSTGVGKHTNTIAQAGNGTLGGDTTSYIIESGLNNEAIRDASGFGAGNPSQVTVSYSPTYNSAAVQSFTSSNASVSIDNSGNLTMGVALNGSSTGSGDVITSTITYRDQYDNVGTGTLTLNVFANQAPTATFSEVGANMTASVAASTNLTTITITDTESDTPFSASLGGTHAGNLKLVPQNANSSSYQLQNTGIISSGVTYNYSASVHDNFGKSTSYNKSITIIDQKALVYGYGWNGGSAASQAAAIAAMGDSGADGIGITSGSVISHLQSGSLGTTFNPTYVGGTMTLHKSGSLNTLSDSAGTGTSTFGHFNFSSGGSQRLIILFASASNQLGKPVSMYDGVPPDSTGTPKEYYVYAKDASIPGTIGTGVYYFDLENAHQGYNRWGMIFAEGENTNNSRYYIMPDSASAP